MNDDDTFQVNAEVSEDYKSFEEFCAENTGRELDYLLLVQRNPLEMDPVTLSFCMRHLVRLNRQLMDVLLTTLDEGPQPDLRDLLAVKGVELDRSHASALREVVFAFRDSPEDEQRAKLVRAFQLLTISRQRNRVTLTLGESYSPPDEGWTIEDFGGDDMSLETVRAVEDARYVEWQED